MTQCPKRFAAFLFVLGALVLGIPALAAAQPYVSRPQSAPAARGGIPA